MRNKKKLQPSEFDQKLSEKLEASTERMIEKMKPTRSEKQREADRRYQAKKRAQKAAEKELTIPKGHVVELQETLKKEETVDNTNSQQAIVAEPVKHLKAEVPTINKEDELTEDYLFYRRQCYRKDEEIIMLHGRIAHLEDKIYTLLDKQAR